MKEVYVIVVENCDDYSASWTGNYPGYSLTIKGIYSTEEKANKAVCGPLRRYYSNLKIIKTRVDTLSDIKFTFMPEIDEDY